MLTIMADLQAIYRDFGIQGIVPYSFQREGAAYRFLVEKIKEEEPLYFIFSEATSVPYLDVMNLGAYAMAYSSEKRAKLICDKLACRGKRKNNAANKRFRSSRSSNR